MTSPSETTISRDVVYTRLDAVRTSMREAGRKAGPKVLAMIERARADGEAVVMLEPSLSPNSRPLVLHAGIKPEEAAEWTAISDNAWRQGLADALTVYGARVSHIKAYGLCRPAFDEPNAIFPEEYRPATPATRTMENTFVFVGENEFPENIERDPSGFAWSSLSIVVRKDFPTNSYAKVSRIAGTVAAT